MRAVGSGSELIEVAHIVADENLPDALGVEIDEGRWFTRKEVEENTRKWRAIRDVKRERSSDGMVRQPTVDDVVVTRAFGERVFGNGPLLGKMLEDWEGDRLRIIGVLRRLPSPSRGVPREEDGVFYGADSYSSWGTLGVVRTEPGRAAAVLPMIEERLADTGDIDATRKRVLLVSDLRNVHFGPQRMMAALMGLLVLLLLVVAILGIAGLTSFSVTERTRQIGTRRALGATTKDIVRHFLTEAGLLTTIGLIIGVGLAVGLNIVLLKVYTDVNLDPGIVAASALVLWIVGIGAALPPALRGARTSPAIATRNV
jgi:putative ABC transport system permease protein